MEVSLTKKKVSVVFPALNEEETIGMVIDEVPVRKLEERGYDVEIIVVDNGSTDNTSSIAEQFGAIVVSEETRGKGHAMRTGFKCATGDFIFMLDADYTYPATYLPPMVDMLELRLDVVLGSRMKGDREEGSVSKLNMVGNVLLAALATVLYRKKVSDVCTGSWGFRKNIVDRLQMEAKGFELEAIMFTQVAKMGCRIGEIPIHYRRRPNRAKLNSFRDGLKIARTLLVKRFQ